jgi:uncharacterized membrane protein YfcA
MNVSIGIIVVMIAGFFQGLTSFGFALISMPFLLTIIPIKETVPIIVILSLFTNFLVIINCIKKLDLKNIWVLILASLIMAPIGVYSLMYLNQNILKIFVGAFIILFSMILLFGKSFIIKKEKIGYLIVGAISGFLNGSISMSGPPIALFLSSQEKNKDIFRANITFYSIILNIVTIGTYYYSGMLSKNVLEKTIWFIPTMLIGVFVGILSSKRLNEKLFKKISLILLIVSGTWTLLNTILGIK